MTRAEMAWIAIGALLLFWSVGAHERLVRLRSEIVRSFAPVHEQCKLRHALLQRQAEALAPVLASAGPRLDALRAANGQADAACAHARTRPGAVAAIASLRQAEDILSEARARVSVPMAAGTNLPDLNARLAVIDATLAFARRQFNDAVAAYNHAVRQFPTLLIAALFGFYRAASL